MIVFIASIVDFLADCLQILLDGVRSNIIGLLVGVLIGIASNEKIPSEQ